MQELPREREGIDRASWISFRGLTGFVGLAALSWLAFELLEPLTRIAQGGSQSMKTIDWIVIVTTPAGWGGLVYACWIRSGRITGSALAFVLVLGVCGMAISLLALMGDHSISKQMIPKGIVFLTGTWILNGLGIVWIVDKVRRIRATSNTDAPD